MKKSKYPLPFLSIGTLLFMVFLFNGCSKDDVIEHQKAGAVLSKACIGTTQTIQYADGNGGYTISKVENSVECGYVAPIEEIFDVPTYADNYTSIASWSARSH